MRSLMLAATLSLVACGDKEEDTSVEEVEEAEAAEEEEASEESEEETGGEE